LKKVICLSFVFLGIVLHGLSSDSINWKSEEAKWVKKEFDRSVIESYKNNDDFDYYQKPKAHTSYWERLRYIINRFLNSLFANSAVSNIRSITIYLILAAALIIAVILFIRSKRYTLFYSGSPKIDYKVEDENIHEIDFERELEAAIRQNELRKAVRLLYLYSIKILSDAEKIIWRAGKTNHEYQDELVSSELEPLFSKLGYYFEYVWYGHFDVDNTIFSKAESAFRNLKNKAENAIENK